MDYISSAASGVANISLGVADGLKSATGVVFRSSEYASKVKEATNDQPWGAPSQLMLEIAEGTNDTKTFDQIMPLIWQKIGDKNQKHWRQIYKALQLLEYLIKNGSERCVDDARMHMVSISTLRTFYYVEDKTGKDQGLNVRNRSKEICDLLADFEKIREERSRARNARQRFGGHAGGHKSTPSTSKGWFGGGSKSSGPSGPRIDDGWGDNDDGNTIGEYDVHQKSEYEKEKGESEPRNFKFGSGNFGSDYSGGTGGYKEKIGGFGGGKKMEGFGGGSFSSGGFSGGSFSGGSFSSSSYKDSPSSNGGGYKDDAGGYKDNTSSGGYKDGDSKRDDTQREDNNRTPPRLERHSTSSATTSEKKQEEQQIAAPTATKQINLFDLDDPPAASSTPVGSSGDDFDDFVSGSGGSQPVQAIAPVLSSPIIAPPPASNAFFAQSPPQGFQPSPLSTQSFQPVPLQTVQTPLTSLQTMQTTTPTIPLQQQQIQPTSVYQQQPSMVSPTLYPQQTISSAAGYFGQPQQNPAQQFAHNRSASMASATSIPIISQSVPGPVQNTGVGYMPQAQQVINSMSGMHRNSSAASQASSLSFHAVATATTGIQPIAPRAMSPHVVGHNRRSTVGQVPAYTQSSQTQNIPSQVNYNHLLPVVAKPLGQQGQQSNEWSVKPPATQNSSFADLLDMAKVKPGTPMTSPQAVPSIGTMAPQTGGFGVGQGVPQSGYGANGMGMGVGPNAGMSMQAMSNQMLWNSAQPVPAQQQQFQGQFAQGQGQGQQNLFF